MKIITAQTHTYTHLLAPPLPQAKRSRWAEAPLSPQGKAALSAGPLCHAAPGLWPWELTCCSVHIYLLGSGPEAPFVSPADRDADWEVLVIVELLRQPTFKIP